MLVVLGPLVGQLGGPIVLLSCSTMDEEILCKSFDKCSKA